MKNNYCVYAHIFPNEKVYIGLTKQEPASRWGINGSGYKGQPVFDAIKKFGWNNIQHVILKKDMNFSEAQEYEIDMIQKYDSISNGYNVSRGGGLGSNPWVEILYNGKMYTSEELLQFSKVKNLTTHDITTRLSHGWDVEDILTKKKTRKNVMFMYNGKMYTSKELLQFSKVEGLNARDVFNRIEHCNWTVERALTQPKNVKKQPLGCRDKKKECLYEYNGKMYKTYELLKLSNVKDLTVGDITYRINHDGWSIKDAITKPKKKRNQLFEYKGHLYSSRELAELSPVENLNSHDITDRLRAGWSIEDSVNKPKRKSPQKNK